MNLSQTLVRAKSKDIDLPYIKSLNCWGCNLKNVSIIREMPVLEVLSLSINHLKSLEDFECCKKLKELYLRGNEIEDLTELKHLQQLPQLEILGLAENPCCEALGSGYRAAVLRLLPNLKKLDGVEISASERHEALHGKRSPPDNVVKPNKHMGIKVELEKSELENSESLRQKAGYAGAASTANAVAGFAQGSGEPEATKEQAIIELISCLNREQMMNIRDEIDRRLN